MFCPECGTEVADTAKSCTKCGRSLGKVKGPSGGGSGAVKVLLIILIIVMVGSAGYITWSQLPQEEEVQGYSAQDREWVPVAFDSHGIRLEVPGKGWNLYYQAETQMVLHDNLNGSIDINILGAMVLNPDNFRVDNKPDVFKILKQETVFLENFGEAAYTVVQGSDTGRIVNKHQLYFRRTFQAPNKQPQPFIYLITMTCGSGVEAQYLPMFEHILDSVELYE